MAEIKHGTLQGRTFNKGDLVIVEPTAYPARFHGIVMRIIETPGGKRTNYIARPLNGSQGVRGKAWCFQPAPEDAADSASSTTAAQDLRVPPPNGALVVIEHPSGKPSPDTLYVVSGPAKSAPDASRLLKAGGDPEGRYYPKMPNKFLRVVDVEALVAGKGITFVD